MKIFPPGSQRLLLLVLLLTTVACGFVFGLPEVVEAIVLKGYLLAVGV